MPGISHVLNIAKEALMAHQMSIGVTGHNVANVNTEGYTRQSLDLTTPFASPSGVGYFGNGVRGREVVRNYDRFMVERLINQEASLNNLQAQQESLRVVETVFNETSGMAVNELLSQFWAGWQDISDNPELISARQTAIQQANLLNEQFHIMAAEIAQSRFDISSNLDLAVDDVNTLTEQIAAINIQIAGSEGKLHKQNDLRDQRDLLVKELSQYLDINYFEMDSGAYTILLNDGHTLVENNQAWSVGWQNNTLNWQSISSTGEVTSTDIGNNDNLGGKIGGWIEIHKELVEGQPDNYLGRLNAMANSLIREVNEVHSQGVGLVRFSEALTSDRAAASTTRMQSTVDITTALEAIPAGTFVVNDRQVGAINGAVAINGLAMGKTNNASQAFNSALSDVRARMTTLVAGDAVTPAAPMVAGDVVSFAVNDVSINYTIQAADLAPAATAPATFAGNLRDAINTAITNYNSATTPENVPKVTIQAAVGDGTNGGELNSLVFTNTYAGDESAIVISGIETDPAATDYLNEQMLGLSNGTYIPDATHNTGELTFFNHDGAINISAGSEDTYLAHLGLAGGSAITGAALDDAGDGRVTFEPEDFAVANSLEGYNYSDEIIRDGGSFSVWIYNSDNTLALPQPVEIPIERAYTLTDVAQSFNVSIENASQTSPPWVRASVSNGQLVLTPDANHSFAFGGDNSNFLATIGLNTFFSGYDATTIGLNPLVTGNEQMITAGRVNQYGEVFLGDETNALAMTNIQRQEAINFYGSTDNTLDGHYNSLVGDIGLKSRTTQQDYDYTILVTNQMHEMRDSTSGVNLDEEMANLIKFQHAYSAAAKLITSSDELLQTLLSTVAR